MIELKDRIYDYLKRHHRGKDLAITVRDLTVMLAGPDPDDPGVTERSVRDALRELNLDGKPVLTSVHPPYGVYVAWAQAENRGIPGEPRFSPNRIETEDRRPGPDPLGSGATKNVRVMGAVNPGLAFGERGFKSGRRPPSLLS